MPPALAFLLITFVGWVNRRQKKVIDYLLEENRVLREQLGGRRLRLTDTQRRRLAAKGRVLGPKLLSKVAGIVTPDTILRWYRQLIAQKYDSSGRRGPGRRRTAEDIERLVIWSTIAPSGIIKAWTTSSSCRWRKIPLEQARSSAVSARAACWSTTTATLPEPRSDVRNG